MGWRRIILLRQKSHVQREIPALDAVLHLPVSAVLKYAKKSPAIAFPCLGRVGAGDGDQGIADMKALPRQPVHMDEIDNKALVAANKQPRCKLSLNFVEPAVRGIFLPVLRMKAYRVIGAVYIGDIRMAQRGALPAERYM